MYAKMYWGDRISLVYSCSSECSKLDANSYTTSMTGFKYKLAHKRVGRKKWSSTENAQREQLIQILEEYIAQLKGEVVEEASENLTLQDIVK